MKLNARDAARHFAAPDSSAAGTLVYGADSMRVALKRQELIANLIGPSGEQEMRLERIPAGNLRKDAALLSDAIKAQGFFSGQRAVFVEDAGDAVAKPIAAALAEWRPGDAHIVVTAGALNTRSTLRKEFETHESAFAVGVYNDPPSRGEVAAELERAGLGALESDVMSDLMAVAGALDPGDLRQTIEKLALYKHGDETPLTAADIEACAPLTTEAALDDMLHVVAEARTGEIGPLMQKLGGQGIQPVGICIGAARHFRTLHAAACDPGGPGAGIAKARPPVYGPRRDRMQRQARSWGVAKLEHALQMLTDTDLQLRSPDQRAPQLPLIERTLIRLSMLAARR